MTMFKIEIPRIYLQTWGARIAAGLSSSLPFLLGLELMTFLSGGSVARAKAAKVSIIKLIHKRATGEIGVSEKKIHPIKTV